MRFHQLHQFNHPFPCSTILVLSFHYFVVCTSLHDSLRISGYYAMKNSLNSRNSIVYSCWFVCSSAPTQHISTNTHIHTMRGHDGLKIHCAASEDKQRARGFFFQLQTIWWCFTLLFSSVFSSFFSLLLYWMNELKKKGFTN